MSREADDRDLASRLREKAVVHAYRASTWALGRAPERLSGEVGGVLAESTYLAWPARRRATRESLARVLGTTPDDPRVDRLGRRTYRNYARYVVALMRLPSMEPGELASRVDMAAARVVDELREQGRGVILVGAHLGHNEAGAAAVADRGWKVSVVADDTEFRELFALLKEQRERWGVRLVPWTSLRELYTALKRKEIVGLLIDWGYRPDGVPVRLFGEWTTLPAGPAILAARTGAVILPVTVRMLPGGRYVASAGTAIEVASSEPADVARAMQAIAVEMERSIRANPGQWWVFKPMWPTMPEERADLLARLPEYGLSTEGT
jgi:KDO2-lipid IV(A) lauroyltransferase